MEIIHLLSLGVFTTYFLIIISLFWIILRTLVPVRVEIGHKWSSYTFCLLALASFAHTWFYMFQFMAWSFEDYEKSTITTTEGFTERLGNWLRDTSLFEQAWSFVCFAPVNWWWSEQLCLFTVGGLTVLMATKGRQHNVKHLWAYMLLGQLVAISVASNLFYLALSLAPKAPPPVPESTASRASSALWISVLVSLITVGLTPFTAEKTFLPNLLIMHTLLMLPLMVSPSNTRSRFSVPLSTLYTSIFLGALAMHTRTSYIAFAHDPSSFLSMTWNALYSHPAQSSIGWDVVWSSVSFVVWSATNILDSSSQSRTIWEAMFSLFATSLLSVGVTAPYLLRGPRRNHSKRRIS